MNQNGERIAVLPIRRDKQILLTVYSLFKTLNSKRFYSCKLWNTNRIIKVHRPEPRLIKPNSFNSAIGSPMKIQFTAPLKTLVLSTLFIGFGFNSNGATNCTDQQEDRIIHLSQFILDSKDSRFPLAACSLLKEKSWLRGVSSDGELLALSKKCLPSSEVQSLYGQAADYCSAVLGEE